MAMINSDLKVFPNPSSNFLKVNLPLDASIQQIVLNDLSGRVLLQKELDTNITEYSLDINNLPSGMYMVNFKSKDDVWTKKIVKQ
jgi:Secretion system C-terminal sorting domain